MCHVGTCQTIRRKKDESTLYCHSDTRFSGFDKFDDKNDQGTSFLICGRKKVNWSFTLISQLFDWLMVTLNSMTHKSLLVGIHHKITFLPYLLQTKKVFWIRYVLSVIYKLLLHFTHLCQTIGKLQNELIPLGSFLMKVDMSMTWEEPKGQYTIASSCLVYVDPNFDDG